MSNRKTFLTTYTKNLVEQVQKHPRQFFYTSAQVPDVAVKIVEALARGAGNKDSDAIKATLKELKIKSTYAAIKEYLNATV